MSALLILYLMTVDDIRINLIGVPMDCKIMEILPLQDVAKGLHRETAVIAIIDCREV